MNPKVSILVPVWNQHELVVKALDSIPRRDDLDVLVWDDGSTDGTRQVVQNYIHEHPEIDMRLYAGYRNKGFAYAMNQLLPRVDGEYFHTLGSDDYLYTEEFSKCIDMIEDEDIVIFDIDRNFGEPCHITEKNKNIFCGQALRFIRTEFVKGIKFPEDHIQGSDLIFHNEMMSRNPKEKFLGIVAYHYNYPREGSLSDLKIKGIL